MRTCPNGCGPIPMGGSSTECPVCHQWWDCGRDSNCAKCLKPIVDDEYVVNWGSCNECFDAHYEGYLADQEKQRTKSLLIVRGLLSYPELGAWGMEALSTNLAVLLPNLFASSATADIP